MTGTTKRDMIESAAILYRVMVRRDGFPATLQTAWDALAVVQARYATPPAASGRDVLRASGRMGPIDATPAHTGHPPTWPHYIDDRG